MPTCYCASLSCVRPLCVHAHFAGRRIGTRVRSALVGAIFRKTLKTDMSSSSFSAGQLTNLMSTDATSVLEFSCYSHFLWTAALSVILCTALLFYVLGLSALGGLVFMVLSIPLGKWTTTKTQKYQRELMLGKDARLGIVGEVLQGMKVLKLFAWEMSFLERINQVSSNCTHNSCTVILVCCNTTMRYRLYLLCTYSSARV